VELILRGGKKKPKTYQILFDRVFNFLNREIELHLNFTFNVKKISSGDKDELRS
tara:strand:+ start:1339 stop:1500 length:162 start_codon:yes stop_codon:yes gene_type:complete